MKKYVTSIILILITVLATVAKFVLNTAMYLLGLFLLIKVGVAFDVVTVKTEQTSQITTYSLNLGEE